MKDLIEALNIFLKYDDCRCPFQCEHDMLYVHAIDTTDVSKEDIKRLEELGFNIDEDDDCFTSFKYGSC